MRLTLARGFARAAVALAAGALSATAQGPRPARVSADAEYYGRSDYDGGGRLALGEAGIGTEAAVVSNAWGQWSLGAGVKVADFDFSGGATYPRRETLYRIQLPVEFRRALNDRWGYSLRAAPGLASDLERVTGADLRWTALALASYQRDPAWRWVGGMYYGQAFGESRVYPALGAIWQPAPEWTVGLIMPRPGVTYRPGRAWSFTALIQPSGGDWNLETPDGERALILETWRGGLEAGCRLGRRWALQLEGGWAFARRLELRDTDQERVAADDLDGAPYVRLGVRFY